MSMFTINCWKDENKEKEAENGSFKKTKLAIWNDLQIPADIKSAMLLVLDSSTTIFDKFFVAKNDKCNCRLKEVFRWKKLTSH